MIKSIKALFSGTGLVMALALGGQASATDIPACNPLTDLSVTATQCSGWYDGNLLNNGHSGADVDAQFDALSMIGLDWNRDWGTVDLTKVEASGPDKNVFNFNDVLNGDVWIGLYKGRGGDFKGTAFYRITASNLDAVTLNLNGASSAVVYAQQSAVPEPGIWAMLLVGFGAIGMALRRRKTGVPQWSFAG